MKAFEKARAVWTDCREKYNQFVGFFAELNLSKAETLQIAIAARSYYRLYVNGEMVAHGPARTAAGYCRVDRIRIDAEGKTRIAVEVAAYGKTEKYCNDNTLEPGLFCCEISGENGEILTYTGDENWKCAELSSRRSRVETMSHSRVILEWYDLNPRSGDWKTGAGVFAAPELIQDAPKYLERRAPYADYKMIPASTLLRVSDLKTRAHFEMPHVYAIAVMFNPEWYRQIPEENKMVAALAAEGEDRFTGQYSAKGESLEIQTGENPAAVTWAFENTEVGFICLNVEAQEDCTLEIVNANYLNDRGEVTAGTYATRYQLKPGKYRLITFEPKLVRYIRVNIRSGGIVKISAPAVMRYTGSNNPQSYFRCSDDDLNRIYLASRRTLRLNTMDIFMDCPERERGGWLCDSWFTARGAWTMMNDLSVEKDFIENFMLTDGKTLDCGLFPEVYPGVHRKPSEVGIQNWSFWLLMELADYYERSGDAAFIEACRERAADCVEGMLSMRGESGLIENLKAPFVDWSISNTPAATKPISVPISCLAACAAKTMGELYQRSDWLSAAEDMRARIEDMDASAGPMEDGDAAVYENGRLHRQGARTESGIALEMWSGFHAEDKALLRRFLHAMGPNPERASDPNVGKSNLFIGLMVRFEVLARMNRITELVHEFKSLYLPQLKMGSDTLFETVQEDGGCHGFNADVGAMLTGKVLGLGAASMRTRTVTISPHVCSLHWAEGTIEVPEGLIHMRWTADNDERTLEIQLDLPEGWHYALDPEWDAQGQTVTLNGKTL